MKTIIPKAHNLTVQHRIFNATLLAGISLTAFAGISSYLTGLKPFTYIFPFISFVLFIAFLALSFRGKNFHLVSRLSLIYLLFIFYPIGWFINAGSQGGLQYFTVFFLIVLLTTMPGKKNTFLILYFLTIVAVLSIEYFFPELVYDYSSKTERYIDLIISNCILFVATLVVIKIFMGIYEKANITLSKHTQELQTAEKNLKKANKDLEDTNKTKDKFFSIIAHDLINPFNSMLGFSELLCRDYDILDDEEKKEYLKIIYSSIENTHKLIDNLLIWSRTQKGTIDFNPEYKNLYLLATQTVDLLHLSALNKSITITTEIPKEISLYTDEYMFSTILRNLLSNAIKFTENKGKIKIEAQEDNSRFIQISVEDNGVGISKEKQSHLFDLNKSTSTEGTENEVGTGLGLFICKEFTEKHGGEIRVESEPGIGSRFLFTIPANKDR
jgi:signal transduction histidine kinase